MIRDLAYINSPVGCLMIEGSSSGIKSLKIIQDETHLSETIPESLQSCVDQLRAYFDGELNHFEVKLDISDAPHFYQDVWRRVRAIPYGKTRSYTDIANSLGKPKSVRAVGQANGKNPLPIIIPCHRVVGKDGSLTGYVYGINIKEHLLRLENPSKYALQTELF